MGNLLSDDAFLYSDWCGFHIIPFDDAPYFLAALVFLAGRTIDGASGHHWRVDKVCCGINLIEEVLLGQELVFTAVVC